MCFPECLHFHNTSKVSQYVHFEMPYSQIPIKLSSFKKPIIVHKAFNVMEVQLFKRIKIHEYNCLYRTLCLNRTLWTELNTTEQNYGVFVKKRVIVQVSSRKHWQTTSVITKGGLGAAQFVKCWINIFVFMISIGIFKSSTAMFVLCNFSFKQIMYQENDLQFCWYIFITHLFILILETQKAAVC